jgi:hypothetical protein
VARGNQDVAVREIEIKVKREVGIAYRASAPLADALKDFVARTPEATRQAFSHNACPGCTPAPRTQGFRPPALTRRHRSANSARKADRSCNMYIRPVYLPTI